MKLIKRLKDKYLLISRAQLIGLIAMLSIASCQKNCKSTHEEASLTLEIEKDTLEGNEDIQFSVRNDGDKVSTDSIEVHLASTNDVSFDLNGKKRGSDITKSLTEILGGSTSTLAKGNSTNPITLKLDKSSGASESAITLELKKEGTTLVSKKVKWSQSSPSYSMSLIDIDNLKDDQDIQFSVRNDGDEVSTDSIEVHLASTNDVSFDLNGKKGTEITESLTEILGGSTSTLAKGNSTNPITLKLDKSSGASESAITLELKKEGTTLVSKKVTWSQSSPSYSMSLIDIDNLKDDQDIQFSVRNDGDEMSTDSIEIHLASTNDVSFDLNGKKGTEITESLTEILGGSTSTLAKGNSTNPITLKLDKSSGASESAITLELNKEGTTLVSKKVTWSQSSPSYSMSLINVANLEGNEVIQFSVRNDGDEVSTDSIEVHLASTNSVSFNLNGKKRGSDITKSLTEILGGSTSTLAKGNSTNPITLKVYKNSRGARESAITLELKKEGTTLVSKKVTWSQSSPSYSMSLINVANLEGNEVIQFSVRNDGDEVSTDSIEVHLASTNSVSFNLNGKKRGSDITKSLTEILGGSTSTLAKGNSTNPITLKVYKNSRGARESAITLELKKEGTTLVSKKVTWSQSSPSYSMSLIDIDNLKDDQDIQFSVRNDGDEVSTDSIEVHLASTNDVSFDLNGKKGTEITESLTEILGGSTSTLAKGNSTNPITLKLDKSSGASESAITLELKKEGTTLVSKKVKWSQSSSFLSSWWRNFSWTTKK